MESFYGGRPGASFIIAKTFPSVVDMVQAFGGGSGYNEVYYDEYVMIQSNVTDNDNGKIYRRGYDLNNGLNGAEFIGSICGPAGPASYLELYPYSAIKPKNSADASTNPVYGLIEEQCDKLLTGTYPDINAFELIPGKETENGTDIYNNNIIYKYYYFTDATDNNTIKIRMGFKIPYPVFDFSVTPVNSDSPLEINKVNTNDNNKFYHNWNIKIPIARKGDSIRNLRIITVNTAADNTNVNYEFYAPGSINQQNDKKLADVDTHNTILVCDIVKYNSNNEEEAIITYYVSDFNIIKNINITPRGYLVFTLPNGEQITSETSILPSIDSMNLNEYGQLSINWNNTDGTSGESVFDNEIQWINDIKLTEDGFKFIYNTKERNNNGEIIYENGQPKRASKIVPFLKANHRLVTDIKFFDETNKFFANGKNVSNDLYFTYIGIEEDLAKLGLSPGYDLNKNPVEGYLKNSDGVIYKRILGFQDSINRLVYSLSTDIWNTKIQALEDKVNNLEIKLKSLNIIDNSNTNNETITSDQLHILSTLSINYHKSDAARIAVSLEVPLNTPLSNILYAHYRNDKWPGGYLQSATDFIKLINRDENQNYFSELNLIFDQIYLPQIPQETLNQIYPDTYFPSLNSFIKKLNKWQNISCIEKNMKSSYFDNNTEYLNQEYAFYRGFGGYTASSAVDPTSYKEGKIQIPLRAPADHVSYNFSSGRYGNEINTDLQAASQIAHVTLTQRHQAPLKISNVTKTDNFNRFGTDVDGGAPKQAYYGALADSTLPGQDTSCIQGHEYIVDMILNTLTGKDFQIPLDGELPVDDKNLSASKIQERKDTLAKIKALAGWNIIWNPGNTSLKCSRTIDVPPTNANSWDKIKSLYKIPLMVKLNLNNFSNLSK